MPPAAASPPLRRRRRPRHGGPFGPWAPRERGPAPRAPRAAPRGPRTCGHGPPRPRAAGAVRDLLNAWAEA
eukprot:5432186-Pyramimonas_sp.AAC.1